MAKKDFNSALQTATAGFQRETSAFFSESRSEAAVEKEGKKEPIQKKGFSFRGDPESVKKWQAYGMAVKATHTASEKFSVDEIWCSAIEEYIANHPLEGLAKAIFDEKTKA